MALYSTTNLRLQFMLEGHYAGITAKLTLNHFIFEAKFETPSSDVHSYIVKAPFLALCFKYIFEKNTWRKTFFCKLPLGYLWLLFLIIFYATIHNDVFSRAKFCGKFRNYDFVCCMSSKEQKPGSHNHKQSSLLTTNVAETGKAESTKGTNHRKVK